MRRTVKMFIVVLVTVMSFAGAQAVLAEDLYLEGVVSFTDEQRDDSIIYIGDEEVIGFPYNLIERELDVEIDPGDCMEITYYMKVRPDPDKEDVAKFLSLVWFCDGGCNGDCVDPEDPVVQPGAGPEHRNDSPGNAPRHGWYYNKPGVDDEPPHGPKNK